MKVMSWNVAKRKNTLESQIEKIETVSPDLLFLQEIYIDNDESPWPKRLHKIGYEVKDTVKLLHEMGHSGGSANLIASRHGFYDEYQTGQSLDLNVLSDTSQLKFPEKIQQSAVSIDGRQIEIWNFHAITGSSHPLDKIHLFEVVYESIKNCLGQNSRILGNSGKRPVILAGDFNSPKRELKDGQVVTFASDRKRDLYKRTQRAELSLLRGLAEFKMVDVFRYLNGFNGMSVYSHEVGSSKFRFDHIFASEKLRPEKCFYSESGLEISDHAPIIAEFNI